MNLEQIYPFTTDQDGEHMRRVHARASAAGILELYPITDLTTPANDGSVFLFRGELSEAECIAATARAMLIGANKFTPATLRIEGNSQFTLWSPNKTTVAGFVKVMDIDLCP